MPEILGRRVAAGEGTASRFFAEAGIVTAGAEGRGVQIIHPIAIGKRQPRQDVDAAADEGFSTPFQAGAGSIQPVT
jgi:hypothetical protein